jgi:hypothetical protein
VHVTIAPVLRDLYVTSRTNPGYGAPPSESFQLVAGESTNEMLTIELPTDDREALEIIDRIAAELAECANRLGQRIHEAREREAFEAWKAAQDSQDSPAGAGDAVEASRG